MFSTPRTTTAERLIEQTFQGEEDSPWFDTPNDGTDVE
jgi:hypothetical protein